MNYDIVIIGGGIHGVGVAQAAAAAGHSVLVIEKTALAAGTSSKSSKLIHGGLRYLESGQWRLVRESLRERAILLRVAPELVRMVPFHIPVYRHTRRRPWQIAAGLTLYHALDGFSASNRFARVPKNMWSQLDGLDTRDLQCVYRYYDAQTDDAALTRAVMHSAQTLGAELRCPADFISAENVGNQWQVYYREGAAMASCFAGVIVNAAGPWANEILTRIKPLPLPLPMELIQGAHAVFDAVTQTGIYYLEASDGRAVFAMPWHGKTLVGTTETYFTGDPNLVMPHVQELAYLRETWERYFPNASRQVAESFAGLRVLPTGKSSVFRRSRETVFHRDRAERPRLLTLYGGKLTGYRATAQRALRLLHTSLPVNAPRADTATLPLRPID
jgi:glycerol-3-phosphate dehydrogenase